MKRMQLAEKWNPAGRTLVPSIVIAVLATVGLMGCKRASDEIEVEAYFANFDSEQEIEKWKCHDSANWEIRDGQLVADAVDTKEHRTILWLDQPLADDIQVEFEAECLKTANDINCFIGGNGKEYSGYEVIIGGFGNQLIAVYRSGLDGEDTKRNRMERQEFQLEKDRPYAIKVKKLGKTIEVSVDGDLLLTATDKDPISDPEHRYFGLSTFENVVRFDNLKIKKKE